MRKKGLVLLVTAALTISGLTGCGSAKSNSQTEMTSDTAPAVAEEAASTAYLYDAGYGTEGGYEEIAEEAVAEEPAAEEPAGAPMVTNEGSEEKVQQNPLEGRKLITTMSLSAETEHFDELMASVEQQVAALGGYVERSDQWNGNYGYDGAGRNRSASMTIRIPADQLDSFIATMEENSNILSKSRNVEDVTLAYVDLESHKKALLTEQDRLLELMEMAETVEDLIALEDKLASVRYDLESMESQLRTYDNKINYSTVYLDVSEVQRLTPEAELTTWGRIKTGFSENVYRVGENIKDFFVELIINIPYIIVWLVVLAVILLIVFLLVRREKKKKAERMQKRQMRQQVPSVIQGNTLQQAETVKQEEAEKQEEAVRQEEAEKQTEVK